MSRRGLGFGFCATAAFLYAMNFLGAVLHMPSITEWGNPPGRLGTAYAAVGRQPESIAVIALVLGIVLIVWQEITEFRKRN